MATKLVNYRLPTEIVAAVAQQSERAGVTRTEFVRRAIEARLSAGVAEQLEEAVREHGPKTERLARRDKARELGISDAEARRLLGG